MVHENIESFISQWTLDEIPACPVGIDLLYVFSKSVDDADFNSAVKAYERGVPISDEIQRNPLWAAYAEHCNGCEDCNEA
jgi:hypothetical protein